MFLECIEVKFRFCVDFFSFEVLVKLEFRFVDVFIDGDFREFLKLCIVVELEKVDWFLMFGWFMVWSFFFWFDCDWIWLILFFKYFLLVLRFELLWFLVVVSRMLFLMLEYSIFSSVKFVDFDFFFVWVFLLVFCLFLFFCRYFGFLLYGFNLLCLVVVELVIMGLVFLLIVMVLFLFSFCGRVKKKF